ncbi:MAG: hypothetical protein DRI89_12305 [Bacteroidetes bacterium]|nr:MAG: hypothetical protein DRI89_12305 [Bacteroidota bacterium]
MKPPKKIQDYTKHYSENDLFKKLKKASGSLGSHVLYYVLMLYFLIADKTIPMKVRLAFVAALGYFILPTDLVADFLPVIGYTDDMALLTFVIGNATNYISPEIKEKAETMRAAIIGDSAVSENTVEDELA